MGSCDLLFPALFVLAGALLAWISIRRLQSLRTKPYSSARVLFERTGFSLVALCGLVMTASTGFNAVEFYRFRVGMPGENYIVAGHRMHLYCMGSGSPAIILDAGLGNDSLIWGGVQPVLSRTTRVCSYDRAGFGMSEALPPPRDADHIAVELHALLATAHVDGPLVLMGHSIAGMYIRDYADHYPSDVKGLVFVDASTPLQNQNPAFQAHEPIRIPSPLRTLMKKIPFYLGIPRLTGACSGRLPGFEPAAAKLQAEDRCTQRFDATIGELKSFTASGEETVHTGPFGSTPILIFSQDPAATVSRGDSPDVAQAWNQMQEDLKKLSTRSRRIIAKGSGHYIQLHRFDLIERRVPEFIEQIRSAAPPPACGTTTTE